MTKSTIDAWAASRSLANTSLFAPDAQRDSCGVAFIATLRGTPGRDIVDAGLTALLNLDHRGAYGADMTSGDGAGILTQIPDAFLRDVIPGELPPVGEYAVGIAYLPTDQRAAEQAEADILRIANQEELIVLAWREVPITADVLGADARKTLPRLRQLVVSAAQDNVSGIHLDRLAFRLRKRVDNELGVFFASLSSRTLVYKGMLTTTQLEPFFSDLSDPRYASEIALVHARFSTSSEASWTHAQPMRFVAHNGQFTSWRGNRDWMGGREGALRANTIGDIAPLRPICSPSGSDSMNFDETIELLHLDGRSLPHAIMMLLPEQWENDSAMRPDRRAFYDYHAGVVEPWDGPAAMNFTDGSLIGTVLDRNALRPARFWVTEDGLVVLASESGVLDIDPATVVRKGRVEPGKMFLVDTRQGRIIEDEEIKSLVTTRRPYADWLTAKQFTLDLPVEADGGSCSQTSSGSNNDGRDEGSRNELINFFDRFRPVHAQVMTGPLDNACVDNRSSLLSAIGPELNMLAESPQHAKKLVLASPVLRNAQLRALLGSSERAEDSFKACRVSLGFVLKDGAVGMETALHSLCAEIEAALNDECDVVVLSDRNLSQGMAPIPTALATSAVHHYLVAQGSRSTVALVVESGDVRQATDLACLLSLGAAAVNPYAAFAQSRDHHGVDPRTLVELWGVKVVDLMRASGLSSVASYRGAQAFETVGLSKTLLKDFFPTTPGWRGSHGFAEIIASMTGEDPTPAIGCADPVGADANPIDVVSVECAEAIRSRFALNPNTNRKILEIWPHRTGVDAVRLSGAEKLRVNFGTYRDVDVETIAPHLDAASLEDLAQLIHDLKNANPAADVQVVLSASYGIGALAAGAAKAHADSIVVVSNHSAERHLDYEHSGILAHAIRECHETLMKFGLRDRVRLGVDSTFRSSEDVLSAGILGAEFFGLLGSITPAEADALAVQVRGMLATLGLRRFDDLTRPQSAAGGSGREDPGVTGTGAPDVNPNPSTTATHRGQEHGLGLALDQQLIADVANGLATGKPVSLSVPVRNVNRSVGTLLGHHVVERVGADGLSDNAITITLTGSSGQSFGAFLPTGITLHLFGDANDFLGKGLSGGKIIVQPDKAAVLTGPNNLIAGNVVGYGATRGEVFLHGFAGDRFAARNQGANFVVEGVGDAACEQMQAGTVVILGVVGRNFASGMTGGSIFVLDYVHPAPGHGRREAQASKDLSSADVMLLTDLLQRHRVVTDSRIAIELLADLEHIGSRFTKFSSSGLAPERTSRFSSALREP